MTFAREFNQTDGQIYVFFIITLAAAEAAVGLAIVIALFRLRDSTDVDELSLLKW
ncbi:MAG: NADH-quinone oxidoreductase subunit K [Planctomycetota bacterium]